MIERRRRDHDRRRPEPLAGTLRGNTNKTGEQEAMTTFQVGHTYQCRSLGDYNCIWTFTATRRTARFVTLTDDHGETFRRGIRVVDDVECCDPFGRYSLSPILAADRPAPA